MPKLIKKPVASKPAKPVTNTVPAKPVAAKPAATVTSAIAPAVAKPSANIVRTTATIVAKRTNFGELSDRDNTYLRFYAECIRRGENTVAAIAAHGRNPHYSGSAKAHDAGAIVRLEKAGLVTFADGKLALTATGAARKHS